MRPYIYKVSLTLFFGLLAPVAQAQSCDFFVNATEGSDSNPGTAAAPLRSFEFAFQQLPTASTVCLAAGEYHFGDDADGIQLTAEKSMTFRLQPFAFNEEVRFSEETFDVDIGTGRLVFEPNTIDSLVFGIGVLNNNASFSDANDLNFLHSFVLRSGTLDVSAVRARFDASVGNPAFVNPDNATKTAPATARFERGDGQLIGSPVFEEGPRTYHYSNTTPQQIGPEWPASLNESRIHFRNAARFTIDQQANFVNTEVQFEGAGDVVFSAGALLTLTRSADTPLLVSEAAAGTITFNPSLELSSSDLVPTLLQQAGTATLNLPLLRLDASTPQPIALVQTGNGRILLEDIDTSGGNAHVTIDNRAGTFGLGQPSNSLDFPGDVYNGADGLFELAGTVTLSHPNLDGRILQNEGQLNLGNHTLTLTHPTGLYENTGTIASTSTGLLHFDGASALTGTGSLPDVQVSSIDVALGTTAIAGSLTTRQTGGVRFTVGQEVRIGESLISAGTGTLTQGLDTPILIAGNTQLSAGTLVAENTWTFTGPIFQTASHALQAQTHAFIFRDDVTLEGQLNAQAGRLVFEGQTAQTFTPPTSFSAERLELAGTAVRLPRSTTFSGTLVLTAGRLQLADNTMLDLQGDLLRQNGQLDAPNATLRLTGTTDQTLQLNTASTLGNLLLNASNTTTQFSGGLTITQHLTLQNGQLNLADDAQLNLAGNLTQEQGSFGPSGVLRLNGTTPQTLDLAPNALLPSVLIDGVDVRSLTDVRIGGTLTLAAGRLQLADNTVLDLQGDLLRQNGQLDAPNATLRLIGTTDQTLQGSSSYVLHQLIVAGNASTARLTTDNLTILDDLRIEADATLAFDSTLIRLTGTSTTPSFVNNGTLMTAKPTERILFTGPSLDQNPFMIEGEGLFGNMEIRLSTDTSAVKLAPAASPVLSGTLTFTVGALDLNGQDLRLSSAQQPPKIIRNMSDAVPTPGRVDGGSFIDVQDSGRFNPSGEPYSLSYTGSLTTTHIMGAEFQPNRIQDLTISTIDAINSPPRFGMIIPEPSLLSGNLTIIDNAVLDLGERSLLLIGTNTIHTVEGQILGSGAVRMQGRGLIQGSNDPNAEAFIQALIVDADQGTIAIQQFERFSSFTLQSGTIHLRRTEAASEAPIVITESFVQTGGHVSLTAHLDIGTPEQAATLQLDGGTFLLSSARRVRLHDGAHLDVGQNLDTTPIIQIASNLETTPPPPEGGFFVMAGAGTLEADSAIPRLKLAPAINSPSDDIALTGPARVSESLIMTRGDLLLNTYTFEHAGTTWIVQPETPLLSEVGYRFRGTRTEDASGKFLISGPVQATLGVGLGFSSTEVQIRLPSPEATFQIRSDSLPQPRTLFLFDSPLTLATGRLDLGLNDIELSGTLPGIIDAQGGTVIADARPAFPLFPSKSQLTDTLYPFQDEAFGEIILNGAGGSTIHVQEALSIPNLTLNATVALTEDSEPLTVSNRFVFGQNNASFQLPRDSSLVFVSEAQILRRGTGFISQTPLFSGLVDVIYELDDGDVTGNATGFGPGILTTATELPDSVASLILLAGDRLGFANTVSVTTPVHVAQNLVLYSGNLTTPHPLTLGDQSAISYFGIDQAAPPNVEGPTPYASSGPVSLQFTSLYTNITTNQFSFPETITVHDLHVDMGNPGTGLPLTLSLHADRGIQHLVVANDLEAASLNLGQHTLSVANDVRLDGGMISSEAGGWLNVEGMLTTQANTTIAGAGITTVQGDVHLQGHYSEAALRLSSDLILDGSLDEVDLELTGTTQQLWLNSGDLTLQTLRLAQSGPTPSVTLTSTQTQPHTLRLTGLLELEGGILQTGNHTLVLGGPRDGFTRAIAQTIPRHVVGTVAHAAQAGENGPFVFPLGTVSHYRPASFLLEGSGMPTSLDLAMRHVDASPLGENGFPIAQPDQPPIQDAANFFWAFETPVAFTINEPFTLELASTGFDSALFSEDTRLVQRSVSDITEPWMRVEGIYNNRINPITGNPSVVVTGNLLALPLQGATFAFALETPPSGSVGYMQFMHNAASLEASPLDIYLNDQLAVANLGFRQATATVALSLTDLNDQNSIRLDHSSSTLPFFPVEIATEVRANEATLLIVQQDDSGLTLLDTKQPILPDQATLTVPITFVQGVSDLPPVDLVLFNDDQSIAEGVAFGDIVRPIRLTPTLHTLSYTAPNSDEQLVSSTINLANLDGEPATVLASGFLTPPGNEASRAFNTIVVTQAGDVRLGEIVTHNESPEDVSSNGLPHTFRLHGNYPNPFNPTTTLSFDLPQPADVSVEVFDTLGRKVLSRPSQAMGAGLDRHIQIDGTALASGVYVYRLIAQTSTQTTIRTGQMILLK